MEHLTYVAQIKLISIKGTILLSIQEIQISRGNKTISSDALSIITFTLLYEFQRNIISQLHNTAITQISLPHLTILHNVPGWEIHTGDKISYFQVIHNCNSYSNSCRLMILTDGSCTEMGVGAAYPATGIVVLTHLCACRVGEFNSVYQAEVFAIHKALE